MEDIVMLPANRLVKIGDLVMFNIIPEASELGICGSITPLSFHLKPHNLYRTSDGKVMVGDWVIEDGELAHIDDECEIAPDLQRKVIASTDDSLFINLKLFGINTPKKIPLPKIPKETIKEYIKEYGTKEIMI